MKKETFMVLLFAVISLFSCNSKERDLNYFNFDDLEYYHKEISSDDFMKEYKKMETSTDYNKVKLKILEDEYPKNLTDTFENELLDFGYEKKIISKSKYNDINVFFSKSNCNELKKSACDPVYRDILIFKKEGKIVGIVKICFRCETSYIVGPKQNFNYFGQCNDFEKLENLIK